MSAQTNLAVGGLGLPTFGESKCRSIPLLEPSKCLTKRPKCSENDPLVPKYKKVEFWAGFLGGVVPSAPFSPLLGVRSSQSKPVRIRDECCEETYINSQFWVVWVVGREQIFYNSFPL